MVPPAAPTVKVDVGGKRLRVPHWPYNRAVLVAVEAEMKRRGCCVIRALRVSEDEWYAMEGAHRVWVASRLGVTITIQPVLPTYNVQHDNEALGIVTAGYLVDKRRERGRGPKAYYNLIPNQQVPVLHGTEE